MVSFRCDGPSGGGRVELMILLRICPVKSVLMFTFITSVIYVSTVYRTSVLSGYRPGLSLYRTQRRIIGADFPIWLEWCKLRVARRASPLLADWAGQWLRTFPRWLLAFLPCFPLTVALPSTRKVRQRNAKIR